MIFVVDTNVFLDEQDTDCEDFTRKCWRARPSELRLAVDSDGQILEEYRQHAAPGSLLKKVLGRIADLGWDRHEISYNFDQDQDKLLDEKLCRTPIEPALLGVGKDIARPYVVYHPNEICKMPRSFTKHLQDIQPYDLGLGMVTPREALDRIHSPRPPFPENVGELTHLLDIHRIAGLRTEHSFLEFKAPGPNEARVDNRILVDRMRCDIAKAVCAMLNSCNGWVFVGVRDNDGEILGFKPEYNGIPGYDHVQRMINAEIYRITPNPSKLFDPWAIDLPTGGIVIAIRVTKGSREFSYEHRYPENGKPKECVPYYRCGPESKTAKEIQIMCNSDSGGL
ncbi:MAG: ATP-binding protein [Acidobacteriota bacterium]|nr:ATP-binding protein [Acidobacteriota bacterium]